MVTIAHLVEKIIEGQPFLQEALAKGIINYAALSEILIPEVEKELKKPVKNSAIMMSLRRLSEKLEKKFEKKHFNELDLTINSNLFIINIDKNENSLQLIKKIYLRFEKEETFTITQGLHEIAIITNKKHHKTIVDVFKNHCKKIKNNVSSLTVRIPKEVIDMPGFYFLILRALAWKDINVIDIVSTYTELTLLLNEDDVTKAYDILRK